MPAQAAPAPSTTLASPLSAAERWLARGVVFAIEGQEWDAANSESVDLALSLLPTGLLGRLGNPAFGPLTVVVNREGRTLSGVQPYDGAANFFSTNDGRNELVLFPGQRPVTVLHEIGHAYNLRLQPAGGYALVLLDEEMRSFMAAAGWRLVTSRRDVLAARDHTQVEVAYDGAPVWTQLSHDDPLEDFANSFALYFWSSAELLRLSSARFDWFEAAFGH